MESGPSYGFNDQNWLRLSRDVDECKPLEMGGGVQGDTPWTPPHGKGSGGGRGRAMQVDPMKPKLKLPGTKRLKPRCDTLLSTHAFNFSLRRYTVAQAYTNYLMHGVTHGRGLHTSTSQLNLSRIRW